MNAHASDPIYIVGSGPNATHRSRPHPRSPNHPARHLHNISHQRTVLPTTNNTLLHRHRALRRPINMVHPRPRNRRPHPKSPSQTSHHIPRNHHHPQPPGLPSRKHPQPQRIEPCGCVGCVSSLHSPPSTNQTHKHPATHLTHPTYRQHPHTPPPEQHPMSWKQKKKGASPTHSWVTLLKKHM